MASGNQFVYRPHLLSALILALVFSCLFTFPAQAKIAETTLPELESFIETVSDGDAGALRGVYVPGLMALPIVQQPDEFPGFVSQNQDQLTQFSMAADQGNVGLLAHNYLSGQLFPLLSQGDSVILVYGDGRTESFVVTDILQYQALDPNNPYSDFKDLATQETFSADGLFTRVYDGEKHVTFQTCIEADGNLSWGRLFVIAQPITEMAAPFLYTHVGNRY